ncbi:MULTISPECIES: AI-2E family transporter [unclassified Janibacter]|uniref:AI-2E family transporter n=1 Tax=unclassified Janibacter TaxID=2649294 RepID=UPI003D0801B7
MTENATTQQPTDSGLLAVDDQGRTAVPFGIRAASEWAVRLLIVGIAIVAAVKALWTVSEIVIPLIVATLLAALLQPVFGRLRRVLPSGAAAGITVLGTLAIIVGLFSFVGTQFSSQFDDLSSQVVEGIDQVRQWLRTTFGISDLQLTQYLDKARESVTSGDGLAASAAQAGLTVSHLVAGFFIAMFALFFFLHDGRRIWSWIVRLFPARARTKVVSSGQIAWSQLGAFTRATLAVAAVDAAGIGIGAAILGVPFASGIALLVFFGAFIPVIGAFLSGMVAVLLALVAQGPVAAAIMLGIVLLVQQAESHLLQPLLLGRAVSVHPLAVILAIAGGIILGGIVGGLIAVPLVAVVNAVGHHLLDAPEAAEDQLSDAEQAEVARDVARTKQAAQED